MLFNREMENEFPKLLGLTTALIYLPTDHSAAGVNCAVFWRCSASLHVCWGGVFNTGALTRGKSGADMKHIRQGGGVCDAAAGSKKHSTSCSSIGQLTYMKKLLRSAATS